MVSIAEKFLDNLYDEHDGEELNHSVSAWTGDYMDEQMVRVINNFSKERLELLKGICERLFADRAKNIKNTRLVATSSTRTGCRKKTMGTAAVIVGGCVALGGLIASETLFVVAGITIAVVGGIIIATDK